MDTMGISRCTKSFVREKKTKINPNIMLTVIQHTVSSIINLSSFNQFQITFINTNLIKFRSCLCEIRLVDFVT